MRVCMSSGKVREKPMIEKVARPALQAARAPRNWKEKIKIIWKKGGWPALQAAKALRNWKKFTFKIIWKKVARPALHLKMYLERSSGVHDCLAREYQDEIEGACCGAESHLEIRIGTTFGNTRVKHTRCRIIKRKVDIASHIWLWSYLYLALAIFMKHVLATQNEFGIPKFTW